MAKLLGRAERPSGAILPQRCHPAPAPNTHKVLCHQPRGFCASGDFQIALQTSRGVLQLADNATFFRPQGQHAGAALEGSVFTSVSQHSARNAQETLTLTAAGIRGCLSPSTAGPEVLPALQAAHGNELSGEGLVSVLTGGFMVGSGHWQSICCQTCSSLT